MRTLKKSLALVLVVAMAVSLLSVGAFASSSTFTDSSKVGATYAEAVDLLTGIGVVNGTTATTLDPTGNYTREQAAKVICYMTLGQVSADALVTGTAPFSDVAADRWSAGYIAYCVNQKIIAGNGDGTFNPTGALTGYAWAKMLVTALGYNQAGELTGSGWEIATAKLGLSLKVFNNDTTAATNKTISRQQAMLLAYNTLFLGTVKATMARDNGTAYVASYTTGYPSFASSVYSYGATSGKAYTDAKTAAANDVLVKYSTTVNGTLGYYWYYNNTTTPITGFYSAETVIGSSTNGKSLATLDTYSTTNSYYIADVSSATTYYINGAQLYDSARATGTSAANYTTANSIYYSDAALTTKVAVSTGDDVTAYYVASAGVAKAAADAAIGYGVKVTFVSTDAAGDTSVAEKVYITTYRVDVLKAAPVVKTNPTDGKSYIYIDMTTTDIGSASAYSVLASAVTGYNGLVAGDVVTVTANNDGSYVITKATQISGTASAASSTALTIGGTSYSIAARADSSVTGFTSFLTNANFYTDAYGYLVYAAAVSAATTNYVYILKNGAYTLDPTAGATNVSYVVFKDGTTATITVASFNGTSFDGTSATTPTAGTIYSYSKNTDGTYALVAPTASLTKAASGAATTSTDPTGTITQGVSSSSATSGTTFKGDAGTVYVVRNIKTAGTNAVDFAVTSPVGVAATGTAVSGVTYYTSNTCATAVSPAPAVGADVTSYFTKSFQELGTTYYTTWTVYTGYTNMITTNKAYYSAINGSDGYADTVFVTNYATTAATASSVIYLLGNTATAVYKDASTVDYYTFPAVVDGVATTVKAASSTLGNIATISKTGSSIPAGTLCSVAYSNGQLTAASVMPITTVTITAYDAAVFKGSFICNVGTGATTTGITAPSNGVVTIGTTGYSYNSSTYVFYISKDFTTVTMGTADAIATDNTVTVTAVTNAAAVVNAGGTPTAAQQNSLYAIFIQAK